MLNQWGNTTCITHLKEIHRHKAVFGEKSVLGFCLSSFWLTFCQPGLPLGLYTNIGLEKNPL